ncbi:MAG: thermonuclease family protein [Aquamicrobium sp.]|uniref:thermonuclease family protein n=1 Tax=Aquamicrobium sp. TaxID=1872579 RepID=UPI00349E78DC|nr:thermonuclease family protein [Aquamicrobium sp.]
MRPFALAVALGGLGALVLAAPALREQASRTGTAGLDDAPQAAAVVEEEREAAPPPPAPFIVRPVSPDIVAPPPLEPHRLERIDPREPLSPIGRAHVPSEGPPKETVLHRPVVGEAGAFEAMGYRIVLAGLMPTPVDESCAVDGVPWPCGVHARTAFRNWLRGRALACVVPPAPTAEIVATPCRLGAFDAGEWLVAQGWARPDPDDARYAAQAEGARAARRGLYGPGPAAAAPLTVTVPELTERDLTGTGILDADSDPGPDDAGASGD